MESQLQCPVCTLFLHIGMNLQTHLETHPKDQVIKALVNMTLTQKRISDEDTTSNVFQCSKYEPIAEDEVTHEVNHYLPQRAVQRRPQQMLIGYSCSTRTRVFRETPIPHTSATQTFLTNALPSASPSVASTNPSQTPIPVNQHGQKILPPPPYGSVVSRIPISQAVQSFQSTSGSTLNSLPVTVSSNQRNGTFYLPVQNVVNEAPAESDVHVDEYTNQTDQNSEYIEHCDEEYLDDDVENSNLLSIEVSTQNERPCDKDSMDVTTENQSQQENRKIRPNSVIYINDDEQSEVPSEQQSQKKSTEGLRVLSDVKLPATVKVDIRHFDRKFSDSFKLEDVLTHHETDNGTIEINDDTGDGYADGEVDDSYEMLNTNAGNEECEEVLIKSDTRIENTDEVAQREDQVLRTAVETIQEAENVNTPRSIIVLPKSPLPSTSFTTTPPQDVNSHIISTGHSKSDCKTTKPIPTKSPRQTPVVPSPEPIPNDERMSNITIPSPSIGKTSVIRLASPKKSLLISESRPLMKAPFSKQPKKIVVKFKKPFVPVVEEDANLQPPEILNTSSGDSDMKTESDDNKGQTSKSDENADQINHPFSPLRQSFTPPPPPSLIAKSNANFEENESSLVDLTNESVVENEECVNPDFGDNAEPAADDNGSNNNEIDIDESMIFSLKCDKEIPDLVSIDENINESTVNDFKVDVLQIKIESWSQEVKNTAPYEESIHLDSKEAIVIPETSSTDLSLTSNSSNPTTTSQTQNHFNEAGPSRIDYGLSSFEEFYSSVRLSPIGFTPDNYTWNQRFSPQYVPFDSEKNSYMDLDVYKNANSYEDRAPSTDSLNIRTDEKMPAKGEISEQESNGDVEGSSWSHQMYPVQDTFPRYPSSYDTTVARESWSLSNDQNLPNHLDSPVVLPKFTSLESDYINADVKVPTSEIALTIDKTKQLRTRKKYRCPACPEVFSMLKDRRLHLVAEHDYQIPARRSKITCTSTSVTASTSVSTMTSGNNSLTEMELKIKQEHPVNRDMPESMNRYLLNYNYSVLRDRLSSDIKKEPNGGVPAADGNCYQCMVCKEQFFTIKSYDAHMSVHPAECYTCGKFFNHWLNLSIHLKRHLNIRDYWCTFCNKRFVVRQNLLDHMNTHSGEAPLQCKICSKRFRRYSNLIQHRNRHHLKIRPKEKDFICSCGEVFHSEAKIAWHRETHDKKPKCCPYCRERFMHKNSLSRHVRLSHPDKFGIFKENAVECVICNKKYLKSSLKAHMVLHTKKREFECSICNKSFTSKWNLKQHKWIHASRSSKPYKCNLCTKAFIRESEYVSHMNTHKAIKPYTCDHCGCQFARKYNWLRHAREHETPKRHRCEDCGKVFHRAYYLTEHKRSHTGERPFECIICGKTSTTKTNHNKHVKIHHARDPLTAEG